MENNPILQPMVALLLWTIVMWLWMYATRIPAITKAQKEGKASDSTGWTGAMLDDLIPAKTQWKAHNYNHLHEQPVLFYAVCLVLAFIGLGEGLNYWLAWAYVLIRIVHSIFQATVNTVPARFIIYAIGSLCLFALIIHAAIAVFH